MKCVQAMRPHIPVGAAPSPQTVSEAPSPGHLTRHEGGPPASSIRHYFPKRLEFYKVAPGFAPWIFRHVHDYDLVHIHALFSFTSVTAAWAARRAGVPYVVRPLGTLNRYGVTQRRPWLKQLSLKLIEGAILRHAAVVHFTSDAERREAEALGMPMRSAVAPLAVEAMPTADATCFHNRFPRLLGKRCVLTLSRLNKVKNLEGLLKAFSLLYQGSPDVFLVIAGDGDAEYVATLWKLAARLDLGDRVVWTGFIDGKLKASAFAAAEVFVLPSFSENFGIAAAEALMAGLPCVLGNGVAIAKEVDEAGAGFSVAPEPEAIAQALRRLLDDEKLRAGMGKSAAALAAERYSLEAMGRNLEALYSRILRHKTTWQIE